MKKEIYTKEDGLNYKVKIKNKIEGTVYKLKNLVGEELQVIVDTGNGVMINGEEMTYHEFEELFVLMSTVVKTDKTMMDKFKIK